MSSTYINKIIQEKYIKVNLVSVMVGCTPEHLERIMGGEEVFTLGELIKLRASLELSDDEVMMLML